MKQTRNQYTGSSGITQREATSIRGSAEKLYKISQKKNLWIKHQQRLLKAANELFELLQEAER